MISILYRLELGALLQDFRSLTGACRPICAPFRPWAVVCALATLLSAIILVTGCTNPPASITATQPAPPQKLRAPAVGHNAFTLTWRPATDRVGTAGYEVFRDNILIATVPTATCNVSGLAPAHSYTMTVKVKDAAGQVSAASAPLMVKTAPAPNDSLAVSLKVPGTSSSSTVPTTLTLSATATAVKGRIRRLEVFDGAISLGVIKPSSGSPATFTLPYTFNRAGAHPLIARATDNPMATTDSSMVAFRLLPGLPYADGFEAEQGYTTGSLQGQQGWTVVSGTAQVTTKTAVTGRQSVQLEAGTTPTLIKQEYGTGLADTSPIFVDFFVKPVAGDGADGDYIFDLDGARLVFVPSDAGGRFKATDGANQGHWGLVQVPLDNSRVSLAWHRLTARLDYAARSWDFYLDGRLLASDLRLRFTPPTPLRGFFFRGQAAAATCIDDIHFSSENPLFPDADRDGIDDAWEVKHGLSPTINDRNGDADSDGFSNIREYGLGTDPSDFYNGQPPRLTVVSGNDQYGLVGRFNLKPLVIDVINAAGTALLTNAPVTFSVRSTGGRLALTSTGTPALAETMTVRTDASGSVQVYYQHPREEANGEIRISAGGSGIGISTHGIASSSVDLDGNGLPDAWELVHFGHTKADPAADEDGDRVGNLQEFLNGTDPTDYYNGHLPIVTSVVPANGPLIDGNHLDLKVTDAAGVPLVNAPIALTANGSGHAFSPTLENRWEIARRRLTVRSDNNGIARVYLVRTDELMDPLK